VAFLFCNKFIDLNFSLYKIYEEKKRKYGENYDFQKNR
jgi:hypothetical protein